MTELTQTQGTLPAWPGLEAAMTKVQAYGAQTGRECIIILAPDGTERYSAQGTEDRVSLRDQLDADPKLLEGCFLVHNHPEECPLSITDLLTGSYNGAVGIIATLPLGGWSAVLFGRKVEAWDLWKAGHVVETLCDFTDGLQARDFSEEEAYGIAGHMGVHWGLLKGIVKEYSYNYDAPLFDAINRFIAKLPNVNSEHLETLLGTPA